MVYRERLWPPAWLHVVTLLIVPAGMLVLLPVNLVVAIVVPIVVYAALTVSLIATAPVIEIDREGLRAGRAVLPASNVGAATPLRGEAARDALGPGLDARAWLMIRGWIAPVVRIGVEDDRDPAPYWILSTRRPEEIVAALDQLRPRTPDK